MTTKYDVGQDVYAKGKVHEINAWSTGKITCTIDLYGVDSGPNRIRAEEKYIAGISEEQSKSHYILIATFEGNPDYGIDIASFIVGIYDNRTSAESAKTEYENSSKNFVIDTWSYIQNTDDEHDHFEDTEELILHKPNIYADETISIHGKNVDDEQIEKFLRYCDGTYDIIEFKDLPIYCYGARYIE